MATTKQTRAITKRFDFAMRLIIENNKTSGGDIVSISQFAVAIGKQPNNMFHLDQRDCTVEEIDKICRMFNINPVWLILGKGEMFTEEIDVSQLVEKFTRAVLSKYRNGEELLKKKATH